MATGDSDRAKKRSPSSSIADPNNSFIKKVTSRVSGFIPTSLSKWFGPGDVIPSVVRGREDDDDEDLSVVQPPPKKRAKIPTETNVPGENSAYGLTSTPLRSTQTELWLSQPGTSGLAAKTATAKTEYRAPDTQLNGDDKSDSGDSTSGYSSAPLQQNKESSVSSERVNEPQPCSSKTPLNESYQSHSRSLFDRTLNAQKPCLSSRRPSFNASIFGSPSFVDRTLCTKRAFNSPFYGGKTMYGGASSYKKPRLFTRDDSSSSLIIKNSVEVKPVNEPANENVSLSKVARRILNTLEHFSSPVLDAKKIPNVSRPIKEALKSQRFDKTPYNRATNRELLIPTVPELLKMKQRERLQNSTVSVRNVAVNSKSVLNTGYCPPKEKELTQRKHVNKMKSKLSSREHNEGPKEVILPEVQLPITTLPKFDFSLSPPASAVPKVDKPPATKLSPFKPAAKVDPPVIPSIKVTETVDKVGDFKFSTPILVSSNTVSSVMSINSFEFSQPIDAKASKESPVPLTFKAPSNSSNSTAPRRKETSKNNGQNTEPMSLQPAPQLVSGSVMDVLGKLAKESSSLDKFKPAAGTWECAACMVRNIPSATRCIACETSKEGAKKAAEPPASTFGNQFKMPSDKWECSVCMVRNSNTEAKCVACTSPKPGSLTSTSDKTAAPSVKFDFGEKFKPEVGTWECPVCMVRNKNTDSRCVACECAKPGHSAYKTVREKKKSSGFEDIMKTNEGKWECSSCMVHNESSSLTCACCEASKPGAELATKPPMSSSSTFKFGIEPLTSTASTPKFIFGVNTTETPPSSTFSFGIPAKTEVAPATKQVFTFGIPKSTAATTNTVATTSSSSFTFVPVSKSTEAPKVETTTQDESKPVVPVIFGNVSSSTSTPSALTESSPKPIFTFGAGSAAAQPKSSSVSSTSGIFSNTFTSSTNTPTNMFEMKIKKTAVTTVTSSSSGSISCANVATSSAAALFTAPITSLVPTTASSASTSTFSFSGPATSTADKPLPAFGCSFPVPQFNFGPNSLPFSVNKTEPTPSTSDSKPVTNSAPKFSLGAAAVNSSPKTDSKPYVFGGSEVPLPNFNFNTPENTLKPSVFNFGGVPKSEPQKTSTAGMFTIFPSPKVDASLFGGPKSEAPSFALPKSETPMFSAPKPTAPIFGSSSASGIFGSTPTSQNGGFNFGSPASAPNFNFGGNTAPAPTAVFGFGSGQISSSSGGFSMGAAAPAPAPSFNPDVKPNFNFSGGSTPSFSATPSGSSLQDMPARKIRKAVRRTQPR